jgi:hypothetical protein
MKGYQTWTAVSVVKDLDVIPLVLPNPPKADRNHFSSMSNPQRPAWMITWSTCGGLSD